MEYFKTASKQVKKYVIALRKSRPKHFYIISGSSVAALLMLGTFGVSRSEDPLPPALVITGSEGESAYSTVNPVLVSNDSSLLLPGKILSNETANIYPRREGIVEDVYVDIGDEVKKGQTVALLLSKGVEGQSMAIIAEKTARQAQAESDHLNAKSVAIESVSKANQLIEEKRAALEVAKREQEGLMKKMAQSAENAIQMRDQAFIAARDARQVMERILTGTNASTGIDLKEEDILQQIGALSSNKQERYDILSAFNAFRDYEYEYLDVSDADKDNVLRKLFAQAQKSFFALHGLMAVTGTTPIPQPGRGTSMDPVDITKEVLSVQDKVLKAKEKWEDAFFNFEELIASEPEIYAEAHGKINNAQSNKVKLLSSQLKTTQENYRLIQSQQEQVIERSEKAIDIASASLRAESAQSGHRKILSPFTGVVSKRFINVGDIVMSSKSAFELVGVPTSLAKDAKAEIQFGLPEHLMSALDVGDAIAFLLPGDDSEEHEAFVTRKSPQVDMQTHTITVQAKIDEDLSLPHHTNVRVRITNRGTPAFRIPSYAVKREDDKNIIWIMDSDINKPVQMLVTVIAEDGEFAEVSGEIDELSEIILDPPDLITKTMP